MADAQRDAQRQAAERTPRPRSLAVMLALVGCLLVMALAWPLAVPGAIPVVRADSPVALQILLPSPENNIAIGPVGANVTIAGQIPSWVNDNIQLGWTPQQGGDCATSFSQIPVAPITLDGGQFTTTFAWPNSANVIEDNYLICAQDVTNPANGAVVSAQAFQVGSTSPASITLAPGAADGTPATGTPSQGYFAGGTLQITGQGFVPSDTPLDVFLTDQQRFDVSDFTPSAALKTVDGSSITSDDNGGFTATVKLPDDVTGAKYIHVVSADGPQNILPALLATRSINIGQAPTPTPTPQPAATVTPQTNNGGGGGGTTAAIIGLGTLSALLFLAGAVLIGSVLLSSRSGSDEGEFDNHSYGGY